MSDETTREWLDQPPTRWDIAIWFVVWHLLDLAVRSVGHVIG